MKKLNPEAGDRTTASTAALSPELMAQQRADLCDLVNVYEPLSPEYSRQKKVAAKLDNLNAAVVESVIDQIMAKPQELGIGAAVLIRAGRTLISFGQQTLDQLKVPAGIAQKVTQAALELGVSASTVVLVKEDKGWGPGEEAPPPSNGQAAAGVSP